MKHQQSNPIELSIVTRSWLCLPSWFRCRSTPASEDWHSRNVLLWLSRFEVSTFDNSVASVGKGRGRDFIHSELVTEEPSASFDACDRREGNTLSHLPLEILLSHKRTVLTEPGY